MEFFEFGDLFGLGNRLLFYEFIRFFIINIDVNFEGSRRWEEGVMGEFLLVKFIIRNNKCVFREGGGGEKLVNYFSLMFKVEKLKVMI